MTDTLLQIPSMTGDPLQIPNMTGDPIGFPAIAPLQIPSMIYGPITDSQYDLLPHYRFPTWLMRPLQIPSKTYGPMPIKYIILTSDSDDDMDHNKQRVDVSEGWFHIRCLEVNILCAIHIVHELHDQICEG